MGKTALRKKEKVRFRNVLYIKYNILKDFKRNLEFWNMPTTPWEWSHDPTTQNPLKITIDIKGLSRTFYSYIRTIKGTRITWNVYSSSVAHCTSEGPDITRAHHGFPLPKLPERPAPRSPSLPTQKKSFPIPN